MGEIKNPENSGVSDPSGDEQIDEEGGDSESFEDNSITDAISQDEADNSEGNADANTAEEPAGDAEESILEMEESEELPALKSSPDSMETAPDLKVTFAQVVLGEDGKASSYADLGDAAEITFMKNSVDSDGTVIKDADVENITFKVTPKNGTKVTAVQYATAETEDDFTFEKTTPSSLQSAGTVTGDPNTEYKISEKIADLSAESNTKKQIRIFITTQTVTYKVSFKTAVYRPDDKGAYDFSGSTASTADVKYGESLKFAVKETTAAKTKVNAVKKGGSDAYTLSGEDHAGVAAAEGTSEVPKYVEYTLSPANVNGLESMKDDEIEVTVAPIEDVKVTLVEDNIKRGTEVAFTAPEAEGYEKLAAGEFGVDDKLIFQVTPLAETSKYKLLAPVAYWTTAKVTEQTDDNTLEVKTAKVTIGTEEKECYVIELSGITENANLHVVLGSELDTEKPDVKTVTFETAEPEDAEHVKVVDKATSKKNLLSGGDKTTANEYSFVVKPEDGYRVTEVRVSGTKTYTDKENPATAPLDMVIKNDGTEFDEKKDDYFYPFNDDQEMKVLFEGTDPAAEGVADAKARPWSVKEVTVTVATEIQATLTDVDVVFDSKSAAGLAYGGYQIEVDPQDGKVGEKEGSEDTNTYTVKEGTPYLQFTVKDAETAPVVKVNSDDKLAEQVEGSGFTYRVPAISLEEDENKIEILRKSKQVSVDYNDTDSIDLEVYDVQDADDEDDDKYITMTSGKGDENYDVKETGTVNVDAEILITGELANAFKSQITEVTFKVGDGAAQPAKLTGNSFEIQTKASEDITVYVNKDTDKVLEVRADGSLAELVGDDVYAVGYADTVTAQIFEKETAVDLFSAVVKDGATNAASKATISQDNKTATIKISESERNRPLTVTLTTLKDRTQMTFTIRSNNPVASVTYDAIKDGKVELQVDTAITTGVTLTGENVQKISKLDWGFVAADAQDAKAATKENGFIEVELDGDNDQLTITARPSVKDGKGGQTARIVLYDSADREKIIEGSSIVVTTTDSAILGKAPAVGTIESTAKTLRVPITSPAEVGLGEELVEGKLMYKIDVKGPSGVTGDLGTAITDALSELTGENAYYDKAEVDADGGVSLKVIADNITNANGVVSIAGGAADFTVDVTLVQIIDEGKGYEDSNIIVGGSDTGKTATTKAPAYENTKQKLNLQKGTTTITTGDEHWVTIAKPKFDEKVGYASVDVAFVDTKTGLLKNEGDPDEFSGLEVRYNDMTQAVEVKSNLSEDHNWYEENKDGEYKNLGVKVTAVTEDTGYGISATVALKVVNGIENIDASAQTYVLKDARKNVTFKVAVDLNRSSNNTGSNLSFDKKYAPKNKKVDYEIVPTTAGVTVDGKGTVKVAPTAKVGESFYVLVKSADGTNAYDYTNPITITDAKQSMGDLVILKDNGNKYTIAADANDTKLEVSRSGRNSYYVTVLRPGVKDEKKSLSYSDLYDSDIVVNFAALSLTPAKGGIYADPTDGQIYVNKLGKVTFKAVDKTDKKNSKSLKVEFVETAPKKVLQITQFAGSAFEDYDAEDAHRYEEDFSFSGSNTTYFGMNLVTRGAEEEDDTVVNLSDTKISFKKNTKNVTPKDNNTGYQYIIAVTGDKAEIQLTSKKNGNTKYTFTNTAFQSKKAPKVALNPKKQPAIQYWETTLTYQLSATTKGDSFEDKYVMLSVDSTKKNPDDANAAFYVNGKNYIDRAIPVRDGNLFDLKIQPENAGSYNLNVAVGYLSNGTFVPEYADAKLAVKVTKQNTNLKVTGKYSLDPRFATKVEIAYNEKDGSAQFANNGFVQKDGKRNYAMNAISENKENRFNEFFIAETNEWGDIGTIGLRDDLKPEQLKEIMGESGKAHLNGFISVEKPGCKRMDVPVTMSFKAVAAKNLKAVSTSVLSGDNMVTTIQVLNGKERVPVKPAYEVLETTAFAKDGTQQENWLTNPVYGSDKDGKEVLLGGDIRLKGSSSAVVGKNKFKVKVTPVYAAAGADPVELNVEVTVAKADTTNKVVLAKGKNKWTVTHDDYVGPTGVADEPAAGAWVTEIPYTFKSALGVAEDTKINVEPDSNVSYVFFSSETDKYSESDVSGGKELIVSIDKAKLMELVEAKKVKLGKKVTVKPTFSYGDEEHKTTLVKDTVSISITLPKTLKESVTEADFKEIEPTVQNMVKTMTAYNRNDEDTSPADSNESIKSEIEKRFRAVAASATAAVTVTHDGSENKFATKYDVVVANGATKIYEHSFTENALNGAAFVADQIKDLGANQWAKVTADPKMKDLFTLTKDSSYEEYLAMIKNILTEKGYLTENIGLTIRPYNGGKKQPSTTQDGQINARVSVKDKTVVNQTSTYADVDYVLYKIETADAAKTRLEEALKDSNTIKQMVADAWTTVVAAGNAADDDELKEALQKIIVEKANDEVKKNDTGKTANENLSVEMKNTLTVTKDLTAGTLTALSYTLVIKDSTPKTQATEVPIDCSTVIGGGLAIDELQTEQTMLDGLTAADLTIPGTDTMTAEDAAAAVKTEILNAKKNPTFVEDNLKVDVKKDAQQKELFVAPSGKTDGLVSVTATYGDNKATKDYDNIVILASGNSIDLSDEEIKKIEDDIKNDPTLDTEEKQEEAKKDAIAEAKVVKRIEAKIRTQLSPANLEAEVEKLTADTFTKDAVITAIETLATKGLESGYKLPDSDKIVFAKDAENNERNVKAPTAKKTGSIPAFTVNFVKNVADAEPIPVAFEEITLPAMAEYQNIEEAEADVKAQLTSGALTIGFVDITTKNENDKITLDIGEAKKLTDAVAKFLQDTAITADGIEVTVATIDAEGQNPGTTYTKPEDTTLVAETLKATITQSGSSKEVSITKVTVKTKANTPAVESVAIKKVGEKEIVYEEGVIKNEKGNGNSEENAIEVSVTGKNQKVTIEMDVVTTNNDASKDVTIKVEGASTADATEGVTCVKAASGTGYDLLIPDDAAGADNTNRKLALKLTATANDKSVTGADVLSTPIYVTLQFVPTVETITITGPDDIEVNGEEGQEASEEITYTATMTGLHLHADDKATFTNEAENDDGITIKDDDSVTGKNKSGMIVKVDYSELGSDVEGATTIKLQAATNLNAATGVSPKTKDITIRNNTASSAKINLDAPTSVTVEDLETKVEGNTYKKYIVSGEVGEVTIPLSITGDAITGRDWTFETKNITATNMTDDEKAKITISYNKKTKQYSLAIANTIQQIKDEEKDDKGELKAYTPTLITLKATAKAKAHTDTDIANGLAAIETSYTFALVVNSSVTGIAIQDGRDDADDDGEGMIDVQWEADQDDNNKQTVTLKPVFEGNHFIESEETKNVTFKFSSAGKTKGVAGAKITKAGVLTIPSTATNGYIEVEAVYGTGDDAPRATRKIHFTKQ